MFRSSLKVATYILVASVCLQSTGALSCRSAKASISNSKYMSGRFLGGPGSAIFTLEPDNRTLNLRSQAVVQLFRLTTRLPDGYTLVGSGLFRSDLFEPGHVETDVNMGLADQLLATDASGNLMCGTASVNRINRTLSISWADLVPGRQTKVQEGWTVVGTGSVDGDPRDSVIVRSGIGLAVLSGSNSFLQYGPVISIGNQRLIGFGSFRSTDLAQAVVLDPTTQTLSYIEITGNAEAPSFMIGQLPPGAEVVDITDLTGQGSADIIVKTADAKFFDWRIQGGRLVSAAPLTSFSTTERYTGNVWLGLSGIKGAAFGDPSSGVVRVALPNPNPIQGEPPFDIFGRAALQVWFGGLDYQWSLANTASGLASLAANGSLPPVVHLASGQIMNATFIEVLAGNETVGQWQMNAAALNEIGQICLQKGIPVVIEANLSGGDVAWWARAASQAGLPVRAVEDDQEHLYGIAEQLGLTIPGLDVSKNQQAIDRLKQDASGMVLGVKLIQAYFPNAVLGYWIGNREPTWQDTMSSLVSLWINIFSSTCTHYNMKGLSYIVSDNNWFDPQDSQAWEPAVEQLSALAHKSGLKLVNLISNGIYGSGSPSTQQFLITRLKQLSADPLIQTDALLFSDQGTTPAEVAVQAPKLYQQVQQELYVSGYNTSLLAAGDRR